MAEIKIKSGPLKVTLKDDRGRVVAALRYPKVRWSSLEIESEDSDLDAIVLGDRRVRLEKRQPAAEAGGEGTGDEAGRKEWDPFREVEFGVRDFMTKAGKAVEDFLEDLSEWSGPITRSRGSADGSAEQGDAEDGSGPEV